MSTKRSPISIRYAAITGMSANCTDWMKSWPTPGQANTVSVTSAKAIREPSCRPVTVITGTRVFLSA